ncbi:DEAD/DEAH box helicase [Fervidicoccus fontis]|uniref:ATP-dependent DNA helicase Hel308 n=1 Tax=Fervidicoccus fontis (strain DSM 19380 / JCM 18336 / VKM B-2539 / Kam940) TaxID=1163730 RepID=I0A300_FERFK|nr:DEAD/DEAH box helicase [Fervidicoccus fontis]AFH43357.1 DEAD/DEAH box helicase domain protein [Fervidicoccus fontis Kam940]
MEISEAPFHPVVKRLCAMKGMKSFYPPQEEAIRKGILDGKNVLMVTQTASGKTFLAELIAVNNVLSGRGKTVYLTPLKALAIEKYSDFIEYERIGIRTIATMGDYDSSEPMLERYDIIVATYEKMDSILRHRPSWLSRVSLVIIDEIHYLDDEKRGPVLESLIAKLKSMKSDAQILGLSATVGNPEEISSWLDAELVLSSWRPIPLKEGVYYRGKIKFSDGEEKKISEPFSSPVLDLINDVISDGGQAIVFVNSRRRAVSLAQTVAKRLKMNKSSEAEELSKLIIESSEVQSLNEVLSEMIKNRVSFHHAGLTVEQRRMIEEGFRKGAINVIVATPTLAAGVNLPARRVIIESSERYVAGEGNSPIKVLEYKQFAGRAGRPGYDEYGEAILIAGDPVEVREMFSQYINGKPESIYSKMGSSSAFRSHLLSYIATLEKLRLEDIRGFVKNTLYSRQMSQESAKKLLSDSLRFLKEKGFIEEEGKYYKATSYGKYVSDLYIDPLSAELVKEAFSKKKRATDFSIMHIIAATPDMPKLSLKKKEFAKIDAAFVELIPEILLGLEDRDVSYEDILSEVKTALFLYDWINEVPEQEICEKYDLGPGDVYSFIESAAWIAYAIYKLSDVLEQAKQYSKKLEALSYRVKYGIKEELYELVSIPEIGRVRARNLYSSGFRSIEDIRKASVNELMRVRGIGERLAYRIKEYALKHSD